MRNSLNEEVGQLLKSLTDSGQEVGLQVAAYVGNELVVDTWSGLADDEKKLPVTGETLFTVWSVTKGIAATCVHLLVDRGQLSYDELITTFWPEFGVNGKTLASTRHALTHRIGIPCLPDDITVEMLIDWERMVTLIAQQTPVWPVGKTSGYHAWTYSWIIGELVRRVDGRSISLFLQEEILRPLGIFDFYLGIPDEAEDRVANVRNEVADTDNSTQSDELFLRTLPAHVTNAATLNRADMRRAILPGVGGIGNARAIARHYAMLANMGELDGVRLLSPGRIEKMRELDTDEKDKVLNLRVRRGTGYYLGGTDSNFGDERMGRSGREFGHPGLGGSIGFADPEHRYAFALTKTLLKGAEERTSSAAYLVSELIRKRLF